jgi:hypothetical protein
LRLKVLLPNIISPQQTGFIPRRHILENISLSWLAHDWVRSTGNTALFLSLDFEKDFDQVNHDYLWETLATLGFGTHYISLVQSLLTNATSWVFLSGMFTAEISLQRGVRQGCPLSPLIYAVSTQPLMDLFDTKIAAGRLWGLQILANFHICYRFFADDLGIFIPASEQAFQAIQGALQQYELATGAKLNLHKSVVVPMATQVIPT